jgi:hypothetical protein
MKGVSPFLQMVNFAAFYDPVIFIAIPPCLRRPFPIYLVAVACDVCKQKWNDGSSFSDGVPYR